MTYKDDPIRQDLQGQFPTPNVFAEIEREVTRLNSLVASLKAEVSTLTEENRLLALKVKQLEKQLDNAVDTIIEINEES